MFGNRVWLRLFSLLTGKPHQRSCRSCLDISLTAPEQTGTVLEPEELALAANTAVFSLLFLIILLLALVRQTSRLPRGFASREAAHLQWRRNRAEVGVVVTACTVLPPGPLRAKARWRARDRRG
jgi:hypothetical protein